MSSYQSQHTLVTKAVQHKINHLWRNLPCVDVGSYGSIAAKYDEALSLIASRITGCIVLPAVSSRTVDIPLCHGGLGFRKWRSTADAAFLAAYFLIPSRFPTMFPELAQYFPGVLTLNPSIPAPLQYAAPVAHSCDSRLMFRPCASSSLIQRPRPFVTHSPLSPRLSMTPNMLSF
jgi:hypothetical protein